MRVIGKIRCPCWVFVVRRLFTSWLDTVLLCLPVTAALEVLKAGPAFIVMASAPARLLLTGLLGRATEHLATHAAPVTVSVLILGFVAMDGELHWMEGVMLAGVYAMSAVTVCFLSAYPSRMPKNPAGVVLASRRGPPDRTEHASPLRLLRSC